MNPAKIDKMDDEISKWRKKDLVAIKRSMSKPGTVRKTAKKLQLSCEKVPPKWFQKPSTVSALRLGSLSQLPSPDKWLERKETMCTRTNHGGGGCKWPKKIAVSTRGNSLTPKLQWLDLLACLHPENRTYQRDFAMFGNRLAHSMRNPIWNFVQKNGWHGNVTIFMENILWLEDSPSKTPT